MSKNIIDESLFSDAEDTDEKSAIRLFDYKVVKSERKNPIVISVEGLPDVDKENFFKLCVLPILEEFSLKSIFIQEPASNKFRDLVSFGDMKKWLFIYQMCILKDKFSLYKKAFNLIDQGTKIDVILLEKSLIGDDIYAQTYLEMENLTSMELEELNNWQELCNTYFSIKPNLIFYLKSDMILLKKKLSEESLPSGFVANIKFFETLELMHSFNFKMISKNTGINIATVLEMEFFMQDENIKNKIVDGVKNVIHKTISFTK